MRCDETERVVSNYKEMAKLANSLIKANESKKRTSSAGDSQSGKKPRGAGDSAK